MDVYTIFYRYQTEIDVLMNKTHIHNNYDQLSLSTVKLFGLLLFVWWFFVSFPQEPRPQEDPQEPSPVPLQDDSGSLLGGARSRETRSAAQRHRCMTRRPWRRSWRRWSWSLVRRARLQARGDRRFAPCSESKRCSRRLSRRRQPWQGGTGCRDRSRGGRTRS